MTILAWTPYDRGHISQVTINPGDNTYLSLRPGSYNFVDVYPAWLVVNNVENADSIDVVTDSGLTIAVPGATSKSIIIAMHAGVRIANANAFSVECTIFDSRITRDIIDGFTASLLAPRVVEYAMLAHFDAPNERIFGDSRISTAAYTVAGGGKFDNCLPTAGAAFNISMESALDVGSEAATIDFWYRIPGTLTSTIRTILSFNDLTTAKIQISAPSGGIVRFTFAWGRSSSITADFNVVGSGTYMQTWRHIALEARKNGQKSTGARLFLDGVINTGGESVSATADSGVVNEFVLGDASINADFDEIRVLRYAAYLSTNFTPPTSPYS